MNVVKNQKLGVVVLVAVAFVAGVALSAVLFFSLLRNDVGDTAPIDGAQKSAVELKRTADVDVLSDGLVELARIDNHFKRNLTLYQNLSGLDANQLSELLNESLQLESNLRNVVQSAIVQRLSSIDPIEALSQIDGLESSLLTTVFADWSHRDVNEAVAYAKTLLYDQKPFALRGIVLLSKIAGIFRCSDIS